MDKKSHKQIKIFNWEDYIFYGILSGEALDLKHNTRHH